MHLTDDTALSGKSGAAQWRDLRSLLSIPRSSPPKSLGQASVVFTIPHFSNEFVISTGAYPVSHFTVLDNGHVCGSLQRERMHLTDDTALSGKSGAAQWRDLRSLLSIPRSSPPKSLGQASVVFTIPHFKRICHLDRSVPGFPLHGTRQRPRMRLSAKRAACTSPMTQHSTGNPGQRSGEICGLFSPFLAQVRPSRLGKRL